MSTQEEHHSLGFIWWRDVAAWVALLVLLLLTLWLAYKPLGPFNLVASLLIAVVKASIVAVIFMRLTHAGPSSRFAAATGFVWLSIMFLLTFSDVLTRPG